MQITLLTQHRNLAHALTDAAGATVLSLSSDGFAIGALERVPGATESFWQLALDIGVISAPVSITCNLIASWIYDAAKRARSKNAEVQTLTHQSMVKLVVRMDNKATDTVLDLSDLSDLAAMARKLEAAVARVDRNS